MAENKTYSELLKDPRWQKKRLQILERDKWTCRKCLYSKHTLHVHHLKYNGVPWETNENQLATLCYHCHDAITRIKKNGDDSKFRLTRIEKFTWGENWDEIILFLLTPKTPLSLFFYEGENFIKARKITHSLQDLWKIVNEANLLYGSDIL